MKFYINYVTEYFADGTSKIEIGEIVEISTRFDFNEFLLDEFNEGDEFFITDEDGNEYSISDIDSMLD